MVDKDHPQNWESTKILKKKLFQQHRKAFRYFTLQQTGKNQQENRGCFVGGGDMKEAEEFRIKKQNVEGRSIKD